MSECTEHCGSPCNWDELIFKKLQTECKSNYNALDIGAFTGKITAKLSDLLSEGQVYAIEMNPAIFKILEQKEFLNKNVRLIEVALSDHMGEVEIHAGDGDPGTFNILGTSKASHMIHDHVVQGKAKCVTLDWLVQEKLKINFDIIKIDVEGAELKVVKQGLKTLTKAKLIIIENHEHEQFYQLLDILNKNNIDCFCLKNNHLLTQNSPSCMEFVAVPR